MSSLRDSHLRSRSTFVAGVVLTAAALFACPPPPPSPGPAAVRVVSFAAVPNVVPPGGGDITLSWETTGASSVVISEVNGARPPTGSLSIHVTDDTTFELTAQGDATVAMASTSVTVQRIEVNGTVLDTHGAPAAGVEVSVNGTRFGVTGSDGSFRAISVRSPYSVYLHRPDTSVRDDTIWGELTTPHPVIALLAQPSNLAAPRKQVNFAAAWTGGLGLASGDDFEASTQLAVISSDEVRDWAGVGPASEMGSGERVFSVAPDAGVVDVFVYQELITLDSSGFPIFSYPRAAELAQVEVSQVLASDGGVDAGTFALRDDVAFDIPVEIDGSGWIDRAIVTPAIGWPGHAPHELWLKGNPPGLFEVPALRVPGAELTLRVLVIPPDDEKSEHPAGFVEYAPVPTDGGVLRIDFPAPPILLSPQEDETIEADATIRFSRGEGCVCAVTLRSFGDLSPTFVTDLTELTDAVRRRAGVPLEPGPMSFSAICVPDVGTIDDAATQPMRIVDAHAWRRGTKFLRSAEISFDVIPAGQLP